MKSDVNNVANEIIMHKKNATILKCFLLIQHLFNIAHTNCTFITTTIIIIAIMKNSQQDDFLSDGASGGKNDKMGETIPLTFSWKAFLAHAGPGCLIAIAYLDPGNLEADLQVSPP